MEASNVLVERTVIMLRSDPPGKLDSCLRVEAA